MKIGKEKITSTLQIIIAAALFGISAPIAKLLLGGISEVLLASLLYLGSGIGLFVFKGFQNIWSKPNKAEAPLKRKDYFWLVGAILSGGVAAPIALMYGLRNSSASIASLLLNFEAVSTTLIAVIFFKEAVGKYIWFAVIFITIASTILTLRINGNWGISFGALAVMGSCLLWGIDNNLTRNISAKNPITIVAIKGISAGIFSLILSMILGNPFPKITIILVSLLLGFISYGVSIVLFIYSLRKLGSARTSSWFGTAPFIGSAISFLLFKEFPNIQFVIALLLMVFGVYLLYGETHSHLHAHDIIYHNHIHYHDEHHLEGHQIPEKDVNNKHSHIHNHDAIEHKHPHYPDIHHRHKH